jgi:hypothetical protein
LSVAAVAVAVTTVLRLAQAVAVEDFRKVGYSRQALALSVLAEQVVVAVFSKVPLAEQQFTEL